ncbi:MAG: ribose-5-phosphate isomerase RpiA [Polyangiaceae bacterium]|nr:ribose-5-phosphate isomerase RpiA [Polyangiaceae bacterium]
MSLAADPAMLARVAERALEEVPSGSVRIGLGTGRAAEAFILRLAQAVREGADVVGVPTSERSDRLARAEGIRIGSLEEGPLDVAFDGADEVDPNARLTKGLGGAMLRERVVAAEAKRFVVLVTGEKLVQTLGERSPLPIEVVPFALASARRRIAPLGTSITLRTKPGSEEPFVTDNGNLVLDLHAAAGWSEPELLDKQIRAVPGVVDTGFFFHMTSLVVVGDAQGARVISPA